MKIECNIKFDSSRQFNKLLLIKTSLLNEIITCTVGIKPENQENYPVVVVTGDAVAIDFFYRGYFLNAMIFRSANYTS